jgi:hypothetical protein
MGYCTVDDMRRMLPEKVQIGSNNIGTPSVPGRPGNQGSTRSNISPQQAEYYIEYASSWLDARLRPFYACPLRRIKVYETLSLSDITSGALVTIHVEDSGSFIRGLLVRIQDKNNMEIATVTDVPTLTTFIVDRVVGNYLSSDETKVSIIKYPDPIPLITVQMAVSFVLDRLWMSEQSPDSSKYGTTMRNLARAQIENILSGEVLLFGQEMTGRRFVRGSLFDAYKSPAEIQKGADKE